VTHVNRHGKRIEVDIVDVATPTERRKPFEVHFVKLPNLWIERLTAPQVQARVDGRWSFRLPTGRVS
jgi:hypothetical protein